MFWALGREDIEHPWLLERCKEVQENPNGFLDLWAREHYKSTMITFALSIQDILSSHGDTPLVKWDRREVTIGIFSCTRPIAKSFLRQVKREFESNGILKELFPDIVWKNPSREAPKWSEDDGLILKRKSNPKESTIEAWGLVDGQPTSKHFFIRVYDDVVTLESVRSSAMIEKVTESWEISTNLGVKGGVSRYIGTRYHFNDTYKIMIDRGSVKVRRHTPYDDGTIQGNPVLMRKEQLERKRRDMGQYTFSSQMMQNPVADMTQGFRREWIQYYDQCNGAGMNIYILVDPANEKKKTSDYSAFMVIGLASDRNYYVLDMVRDRLNLTERANMLFYLHRKWRPIKVGYEKYGMQADIPHIQDSMNRENYRFNIAALGGRVSKNDRIRRLIPLFEQGRIYFPNSCFKTNYERKTENLVDVFINAEFLAFPVSLHDDMLDCLARILEEDLGIVCPMQYENEKYKRYKKAPRHGGTWMSY